MNLIKKGLLTLGTTVALAGAMTLTNSIEVEAASWEPRTVTEIESNIENNGSELQYTVRWGDTLGAIATAFDVSLDNLAKINQIANKDFIMTGNVLSLSADHKTVSVEDSTSKEVKSYDISEPEVKEVEPEVVEEVVQEESNSQSQVSGSEADAKAWIAFKESTDNYNARNGRYIGKYQLTDSYLNGDFSPENQERVANEYVASRYGSWVNAKAFWVQNGWY